MTMQEYLDHLKVESDKRFEDFKIEEIDSIEKIREEAYLEKPTWLGGDTEFVCLFIDLDDSSKMSFRKHPKTMAKIYDYFTQNLIDVMSQDPMKAAYIDIKGDGAFGIYEGQDATFKALAAAVTFKTFFEKYISPKFSTDGTVLNCKLAIHKDKILVRKIGRRGDNNNEVWAGRVVNNAAKLASLQKEIRQQVEKYNLFNTTPLLIVSDKVYEILLQKHEHAIMCCPHNNDGTNAQARVCAWESFDVSTNDDVHGDIVYYTPSRWCAHCVDTYLPKILF